VSAPDPVPPPSGWASSPEPGSPAWLAAPWSWYFVPRPVYTGNNQLVLLRGGAELFPAMIAAIDAAQHEVWLTSYICEPDASVLLVLEALERAARRGVQVRMVVDGFGSKRRLAELQRRLPASGVALAVFRPLERWTHWLQPGQLRRLHMKLCSVDGQVGFVGGINLIDDHFDQHHGHTELPRLDYAVAARGPVATALQHAVRAMWSRARFGRDWRSEVQALAHARHPLLRLRVLWRQLRLTGRGMAPEPAAQGPMRAAFVVRDNVRQRRTIERAYIDAIRHARERVWLISPYFYPGREFRQVLCAAAQRGVDVRLLLQGKPDYRLAAMAAHVLYEELMRHGVVIHEYTPAFLHAKVAVVDADWATVGSSNIDPLSLLLNLEANLIVRDTDFTAQLALQIAGALADSHAVGPRDVRLHGWVAWLRRVIVAWCAHVYLRLAGVTRRD
jgi:cardiolipin synthase